MINVISSLLGLSVAAETAIATDIISTGSSLGNMGAAAILGVVCVSLIVALVKVYTQKQEENKETLLMLKDTISKNTETLQSIKDHCINRNK